MSTVAQGRSLAAVLRGRLAQPAPRVFAAEVTLIPDASHVRVDVDGTPVVVAHLASYTPIVGDTAYILAQGSLLIALGAIR